MLDLERGDRFVLIGRGEARAGTVVEIDQRGCVRFVDDGTGRLCHADLSHWDGVRVEATRLSRRSDLGAYWLRDAIAADPALLGLGSLRNAPSAPHGATCLVLDDPATGARYTVDIQCGRADEAQLVRSEAARAAEERRSPEAAVVAVVVAETIPDALRPQIGLGIEARAAEAGHGIRLAFRRIEEAGSSFAGLIGAA
jgi:hypothetical protein